LGTAWRVTLNSWLEICHGAVLLVSPHALNSVWVQNEATILGFRFTASDHRFPLLIIHRGTEPADIRGTEFGITRLDDIQAALKSMPAANVLDMTREYFRPLLERIGGTEEDDIHHRIVAGLERCDERSLVQAGETLEFTMTSVERSWLRMK
jgi:hypothetical protein